MTPDLDLSHRCQRVLDIAAAERRDTELRRLPEVSRDFGYDPITLDRAAYEHSASICKRMREHTANA